MTERTATLQEVNLIALFNVPVLLVYAGVQTGISLLLGPQQANLKLVVEPHLLLIGLILHVQWRKVDHTYRAHGLTRPWWMLVGDAMSFVTTFWALATLIEAFLRAARLI